MIFNTTSYSFLFSCVLPDIQPHATTPPQNFHSPFSISKITLFLCRTLNPPGHPPRLRLPLAHLRCHNMALHPPHLRKYPVKCLKRSERRLGSLSQFYVSLIVFWNNLCSKLSVSRNQCLLELTCYPNLSHYPPDEPRQ